MRATLTFALLSGLFIPSGVLPAHAQGASFDGGDLPCNEACRSWLGPAYTGPDAEQPTSSPPTDNFQPVANDDETPSSASESPRRSEHRAAAHDSVRIRPERRPRIPMMAERRSFEPPHARPLPKTAATEPLRPVHPKAPLVIAVARPEPAKTTADAIAPSAGGAGAQAAGVPGQPTVRLEPDSKMLTVSLNGSPTQGVRLTAAEADRLVEAVGAARAKMQPPAPQNWAFGQTVATIYDPRWTTEAERKKGDTLLHIRDPRFGWLHYTVPRMTAQQLGNLLQKQAALPIQPARRAEATP